MTVTDDRGPYFVYRLNNLVRIFPTRDEAADYVWTQPDPHDHEILDRSDT